jgi:hypothetical protein
MSVIARVRGQNRTMLVKDGQADPCWHCRGQKKCDCCLCGKPGEEVLEWILGICGSCRGVGYLCWPNALRERKPRPSAAAEPIPATVPDSERTLFA